MSLKKFICPLFALFLNTHLFFVWTSAALAQSNTSTSTVNPTPQNQPDFVAVMDLEAKGGITQDEASIITERMRAQLLRTNKFRILERAKMTEILKEQGFQQGNLCDTTSCSVEMGRLLAVNRIITGSVSKLGELYTLSIRMLDVEKGTVVKEEFHDCRCPLEDVLIKVTAQIAAQMAGVQESVIVNNQGEMKRTGTLSIDSSPSGSTVYIDGEKAGITPLKKQLQEGEYQLILEKKGYESYSTKVIIESSKNTEKSFSLEDNREELLIQNYRSYKREEVNGWNSLWSLLLPTLGYYTIGETGWGTFELITVLGAVGLAAYGGSSGNSAALYTGIGVSYAWQLTSLIHVPIIALQRNEALRKKYGLTEEAIRQLESSGKVSYFYSPPTETGLFLNTENQLGLSFRQEF